MDVVVYGGVDISIQMMYLIGSPLGDHMIDTPDTPSWWKLIGGTNEVVKIRRMGKVAGTIYIRMKHRNVMSKEDVEDFTNRFWREEEEPTPTYVAKYDPHRRKLVAVLWLLGASQAQIARHYGVAQQTIHRQLDRELQSMHDRNAQRMGQPPMEHEILEFLEVQYYQMMKTDDSLAHLDTIVLAKAMVSLAEAHLNEKKQTTAPDPYAELLPPEPVAPVLAPAEAKPGAQGDALLEAIRQKVLGGK